MSNIGAPLLSYQPQKQTFPSNRTRTVLALCALGCVLLAEVGCVLVGFMQISLLNRAAGVGISSAEAEANDLHYRAAHIVLLVSLILSCIFLLMWMYRAHKNLRGITTDRLEFTPGGAVGWWFCPFLNLVRPYQVMKEIFNVSRQGFGFRAVPVVGAWWTFWIIANITSRIGSAVGNVTGDRPTIPELINGTWANMIDIPFFLVSGVLLMWIIYTVDTAQERRRNIAPETAAVATSSTF